MKIRRYSLGCVFFQLILAIVYCGYVFYQSELINEASADNLAFGSLRRCIILFALWILFDFAENYYREYAFAEICKNIKAAYAHKFIFQNESEFLKRKDHFSYAVKTINTLLMQYYYLGLYVSKSLVFFLFSLFTVFKLSYLCGIMIILVTLLFELIIRKYSSRLQEMQGDYQTFSTKVIKMVSDSFNQKREIHFNQSELYSIDRFTKANADSECAKRKYDVFLSGLETINVAQNMMMYILIMMAGCFLAHKGWVGIGIVISVSELAINALNNYATVSKMSMKVIGAKKIKNEFWDDLSANANAENPREYSELEPGVLIKVENLGYSYDNKVELFQNVSFDMHENEKILITGESGSGKSTLLNLLINRLEPANGKISINSDDYIYVEQIPFMFVGTLRDNLTFGADIPDEKINEVLSNLGLGLHLDLMVEQNGSNLSGGQKSRIGLARALLFRPKLIIIDEITAELDAELGRKIEYYLLSQTDSAVLMVSHRVYFKEKYSRKYELKNSRLEKVI